MAEHIGQLILKEQGGKVSSDKMQWQGQNAEQSCPTSPFDRFQKAVARVQFKDSAGGQPGSDSQPE